MTDHLQQTWNDLRVFFFNTYLSLNILGQNLQNNSVLIFRDFPVRDSRGTNYVICMSKLWLMRPTSVIKGNCVPGYSKRAISKTPEFRVQQLGLSSTYIHTHGKHLCGKSLLDDSVFTVAATKSCLLALPFRLQQSSSSSCTHKETIKFSQLHRGQTVHCTLLYILALHFHQTPAHLAIHLLFWT